MPALLPCLLSCLLVLALANADVLKATCKLVGTSSMPSQKIKGSVDFSQNVNSNTVTVKYDLNGFTTATSTHGFHVHQIASIADGCKGAGSHFDGATKQNHTHGAPSDAERHVGDLGNIVQVNGKATSSKTDTIISLKSSSNNYIGDRAIVVHALVDDLGKGGDAESKKTGNAGPRIGCCVIETSGASTLLSATSLLLVSVCSLMVSLSV